MSILSRLAAVLTGMCLSLGATVALAPSASAAFSPAPVGPTWVPDGPVHAIVTSGDRVYVGGTFAGGVAALDARTGALIWRGSANGDVRALAMANGGTHVVAGGAFNTVSGVTHRRIALLSASTGAADPRWKGSAGGTVRDIVVDGGTAYFGGAFVAHNGISQQGLGAVSVTPGAPAAPLTSFKATTNGIVYSLAMNGSRLFVGGKFTAVNGVARNQLASVNTSSQTLESWAPPLACSQCNLSWDLVVNPSLGLVYTATRNAGAVTAFSLSGTGQRVWGTPANGDAQALTLVGETLYVGGHFTGIKSQPRTILAALNPTNGSVLADFAPRFVTTWPGVWAMASTSTRLYVGGDFTHAGSSSEPKRPYLAMFG